MVRQLQVVLHTTCSCPQMRVRHNLALFLGNLEVRVQNYDRGRETAKGSDPKVVGIEVAVTPIE